MNKYAPVPEHCVGLWERVLLEDGKGRDETSNVLWLQTRSHYCDLRIPMPRPQFVGTSLAGYSDAELRWLLGQQGFAGRLEVTGDIFRWHRFIDFQPDSTVIDAGRMVFGQSYVTEHGLYADYREEWRHTPPENQDGIVLELIEEQVSGEVRQRRGLFIAVGEWFMYSLDRHHHPPAASSLLALAPDRSMMLDLLMTEIGFGLRSKGSVPWQVTLATLPFLEGGSFFREEEMTQQGSTWLQHDNETIRRWRVVERTKRFCW